jgi:hypothetical protein
VKSEKSSANLDLETKPLLLAYDSLSDIHEYVHAVCKDRDLLGNLPLHDDYIFDEAPADKPDNYHAEMLFLGESNDVQSWANLRIGPKGEGVVFYSYHTIDGGWRQKYTLDELHLMYPFRAVKDSGSARAVDYLTGLIRYIYREAVKVDRIFSTSALQYLVVALRDIDSNYSRQGGRLKHRLLFDALSLTPR